jgi:L-lactate dehydrogenase complex protein LldG
VSTARDEILGGIRRALGRSELDAATRARIDARLRSPTPNLLPRVGGDVVDQFLSRARTLGMTVTRIERVDRAPAAVAAYVAERRLPRRVVAAAAIRALPWPQELDVRVGPAGRDDLVSVTPCFAAVAETGSLALVSGPESPTTLNFVPDDHIVILEAKRIVRHQEEVWRWLRSELPVLPRTVNLISGPSRTADVEQVVQLGVHGPRRVHVLLAEN